MSDASLPPADGSDGLETLRDEREARIAQLEARERRPRGLGVHPAMALMAMAVVGFLLWQDRLDLAYLFASRTPVTLGQEGTYPREGLTPNRYVQIHGRPTSRASFGEVDGRIVVMVGLEGSAFVLRRPPLPGEAWQPGAPPPAPNPAAFSVRGRLLREDQDPRFAQGYEALRSSPQLHPIDGRLYGIVLDEIPGTNHAAAAWGGLLVTILIFNLWLLARGLEVRVRRRRLSAQGPGTGSGGGRDGAASAR